MSVGIAYNPCKNCKEMDKCSICELTYFRKGYIKSPPADVVEVRHGTWYHGTEYGAVYAKCSACGRKMNYSCYGYAYCALCGAKMDGERSENV